MGGSRGGRKRRKEEKGEARGRAPKRGVEVRTVNADRSRRINGNIKNIRSRFETPITENTSAQGNRIKQTFTSLTNGRSNPRERTLNSLHAAIQPKQRQPFDKWQSPTCRGVRV
jgi:hypothetical protein